MINNEQGIILLSDNFEFQLCPREIGEIKGSVKEMQGKELSLHTKTDWNTQSFTDHVLRVTWKQKL